MSSLFVERLLLMLTGKIAGRWSCASCYQLGSQGTPGARDFSLLDLSAIVCRRECGYVTAHGHPTTIDVQKSKAEVLEPESQETRAALNLR